MMPASQLMVTVGEHNLNEAEKPSSLTRGIKRLIVHENFECGKWNNDIALLESSTPITWSDSVKPACVPARYGTSGYSNFSGKRVITAGWGWLGEDKAVCKYTLLMVKRLILF